MSDDTKRTPAEEARAEVESAFADVWPAGGAAELKVALIARLTPVFERAQFADSWSSSALRERAERAEAQSDERHDLLSAERRKNDELRRDILRTLDERDELQARFTVAETERADMWRRMADRDSEIGQALLERDEARRERDELKAMQLRLLEPRPPVVTNDPEEYVNDLVSRACEADDLRDALARLRVREGQLREALAEASTYLAEWAIDMKQEIADVLSSPSDAPDVLGAAREAAKAIRQLRDEHMQAYAGADIALHTVGTEMATRALATLRAAGVIE